MVSWRRPLSKRAKSLLLFLLAQSVVEQEKLENCSLLHQLEEELETPQILRGGVLLKRS